jgi:membrane associated rhomboid family serine protease
MLFPLYDLNPHERFPWFTLLLIAANIGVTGWMYTHSEREQSELALRYGFVPARLSQIGKGKPIVAPVLALDPRTGQPVKIDVVALSTAPADVYLTFLTTMFLHGGWLHVITNMWMLWIFGNNIEDRLGHLTFMAFYAIGGMLATLCYWLSDPAGLLPVVGASGAVAAVLGGYAVTYPMAKVRTLIFFLFVLIVDLPALVLLGLWFVMQVVSGMMGLFDVVLEPVAFWAHVGGFVAGMVLMPLFTIGASPPGSDWRKESEELFRFDDPRFIDVRSKIEDSRFTWQKHLQKIFNFQSSIFNLSS